MINSICIKTNNQKIIHYLLTSFENTDLDNIYLSNHQFKIYENVIIHYKGDDENHFYATVSDILANAIIHFYEKNLLKNIIHTNYFYFTDIEKKQILEICMNELLEKHVSSLRHEEISIACLKYFLEKNSLILDGFVHFRLQNYIKILDNIVDSAVNGFLIEKEYLEFIHLLKVYINSKASNINFVHLIYTPVATILLDEAKNVIPIDDDIFNAKYLSDITFSKNDYCLNTLLTLLPQKICIHLLNTEDEFINTLKLIFESRVTICTDCNLCNLYKTDYSSVY